MTTIESELKLVPADPALFDRLLILETLGPFQVRRRAHEGQTNTFFDAPARPLGKARVGFRRRTVRGQPGASWSLKLEGKLVNGVMTRPEIEVFLDADTPPIMALALLRQAAFERGAPLVAERVDQALAGQPPVQSTPFLHFETERDVLDLLAEANGWAAEMALDRMTFQPCGHADYEIEVELKEGDASMLEAARQALLPLGQLTPSKAGKLTRAQAHRCPTGC